eukprot:COSAG04_NODE_3600_length_2678_cov_2.374564_3_plen_64_part_00
MRWELSPYDEQLGVPQPDLPAGPAAVAMTQQQQVRAESQAWDVVVGDIMWAIEISADGSDLTS